MSATLPELTTTGRKRISAVLERAATDIEFRERLLDDPASALEGADLEPAELDVLTSMHRVALEEWGVDVRRYRAFLRDNGYRVDA